MIRPRSLIWPQTIRLEVRPSNIRIVNPRGPRPGPKKVQRLPIASRRRCEFVQSIDYSWRQIFEAADVVSEGAVRSEADGPVYYGSTSVQLIPAARGQDYSKQDEDELVKLLHVNPHAKVRAVRIACLEAQLRAGCPIGAVKAELTICKSARGVRVNVDVEARVASVHASHTTRTNRA